MADLGPWAFAAVAGLLRDVVEQVAGSWEPLRQRRVRTRWRSKPRWSHSPSRQQAGEPAEDGLERGPVDRVGVERLPSGERAPGDPPRDPAEGEAMGRLIEGEGRETAGLGPLDLEDLLDSIHDGEYPGGGVEDRELSDREGGVDDVDPEGGRGSKTASGVTRTEVADGPLADLSELGVPVRLPLVEVEMPADPVDLSEGRMSVSWGTYCKYKHLTLEPKILERGSGRIRPHPSRIRPRIQAQDSGNKRAIIQGYNAPAAVDVESQVIVMGQHTQENGDGRHLAPMTEELEQELGELPAKLLSDAGCFSEAQIRVVESKGGSVYCSPDSWRVTDGAPCPGGRPPKGETFTHRFRRKVRSR